MSCLNEEGIGNRCIDRCQFSLVLTRNNRSLISNTELVISDVGLKSEGKSS